MELMKVRIADIDIPEVRARSRLTDEQREFLKASKVKYGDFDPILLRPCQSGRYELIDGENRLKEELGKGTEVVEVLIASYDDKDAAMVNIFSNFARGTQDPISAAQAIRKALDAGGTVEELAGIMRHTTSWIKKMVALLDLPERYQKALQDGELKVSHIDEVLRLPTAPEMDAALQTTMKLKWPATVLKNYVDNRMTDLRVAEKQGDLDAMAQVPLPEMRESMSRYRQCMICQRMVDASQIRLPTMCEDCMRLGKYCISQLGMPDKALEEIFKAVDFYRSYQRFEQYKHSATIPPQSAMGTEQSQG